MKKITILIICIAIVLVVRGVLAQSAEPAKNHDELTKEQKWLKQLVGTWDTEWKITMQPNQPPEAASGTDSVRTLGDHWIIAEAKTTMMGAPYNGMLSLGYDPKNKQFIGTWIDSFGCQLWVYKGTLNEVGDTLTLETKGPSPLAPDKTVLYREVIRMTGKDRRTFTSSIETDEGAWKKLLTVEYRRKK